MEEGWDGREKRVDERRDREFCPQHEANIVRIEATADNAGKARTISEVAAGRMSLMMWGGGIFLVAALTFMGKTSADISKMGRQVATLVTANSISKRYIAIHEEEQDRLLAGCVQDIEVLQHPTGHEARFAN